MRILFDHGTPRQLASLLPQHRVASARSMGWERLSNGILLAAAENEGFEVLLTTDRRIRYQQNLTQRRIAILVLVGSTKWSQVRLHAQRVASAVGAIAPNAYVELFIPFKPRPPFPRI